MAKNPLFRRRLSGLQAHLSLQGGFLATRGHKTV